MNDFQREIYKTVDRLTEQKLKGLGFDISKRGKVISVNSNVATVQIDGEDYTCKLRRGINVIPNDIVYVKFPQNNESDKYIETILGVNEVAETINITAEEILAKLKTVDGAGSGIDADFLDGKHASEFALVDDLGGIDISGEAIVQNINSSTAIIDDDNLSLNVNDAVNKKHTHANKSIIDTITQLLIDGWNSAVAHISDTIKHITSTERTLWNTVSNKTDVGHIHTESNISNLDKYTKSEVDAKLLAKLNANLKGVNNGVAELDSTGKVPSSQLPSYVDDVLEFTNLIEFPTIGESGKIYIDATTNITYRWSGTTYTPIGSDLTLGETLSTAYRGDRGKIAYEHSQTTHDKNLVGLGNIDNIKQATKSEFDNHNNDNVKHMTPAERTKWNTVDNKVDKISGRQLSTEDYTTIEKSKLAGIEGGANNYTLPIASNQILGGIKIGANLSIAEDGTVSALSGDERTSFIIKQEMFVATEGQTLFNLTKGNYKPNTNTISVYLYGGKQPNIVLNEISTSSFEITEPLKEGNVVIVEYFELSSATPYPIHGDNHLTGGYDPMPKATTSSDGLMAKEDKSKIDSVESGANKYAHPSTHSVDIITESLTKKIMTSDERLKLIGVEAGATKNDTDASLKNRINHTGTQTANTISDFANTVRSTVLTGLSTTTNTIITTTDTILSALGKLQKQITDNLTTLTSHIGNKANPHEVTKAQIDLEDVDNTSDVNKPISTAMQAALNGKVDNSRLLTDVPSGAKFTDTITTINSKTGAIAKADIVALGIPAQDTIVDISGKADKTYVDNKVKTDVPTGAKFTDTVTTINGKTGAISKTDITALGIPAQDTVYNHSSSHPASMIVESASRRFVSDTEKATWSNKAEVSDIPTKVSELSNDSNYVTQGELGDAGFGDMVKSVYDQNNNGIVDNAEKLGGQPASYYQQAIGYTPVNKAGDDLNGSYTGNGKLFLKNSFYGMGGQTLSDFSMTGIYNRQELINVAHKGGVEVNIEGAGNVSRTKESLNLMFNGEPDFLNISGINATTTKIEIIADLGHRAEVYSDANWQPFVQLRIAPGGSHNWFNKIRVEVSDDKVNWSYPDDETAWGTNDFLNNQAIPSLWMGKNASPKPSYLWRYIRFTFTDIRGSSGNLWISQLGMRHRNAPYTKKYVTATGDKMYGALDMNSNKISNVASPTNINDVATKKYVDDKNVIHIGTSAPSDTNTVWIDTSL